MWLLVGLPMRLSDFLMFCLCREVFKAKHRQTGKKVALKKVLMENEKEGVRTCSCITWNQVIQLLRLLIINADITHLSVFVLLCSVSHHCSEGNQDLTAAETWECGEPHWDLQDKRWRLRGSIEGLIEDICTLISTIISYQIIGLCDLGKISNCDFWQILRLRFDLRF